MVRCRHLRHVPASGVMAMFGWLGAYLERRRKARAAKMASDSAQMAAMLQANAP